MAYFIPSFLFLPEFIGCLYARLAFARLRAVVPANAISHYVAARGAPQETQLLARGILEMRMRLGQRQADLPTLLGAAAAYVTSLQVQCSRHALLFSLQVQCFGHAMQCCASLCGLQVQWLVHAMQCCVSLCGLQVRSFESVRAECMQRCPRDTAPT